MESHTGISYPSLAESTYLWPIIGLRKLLGRRMDLQRAMNRLTRQYLDSLNSFIVEQGHYGKKGGNHPHRRIRAIDSTGFSIWRYVRWLTVRHGRRKRRKDFLKLHFIVDYKSLLILAFKTRKICDLIARHGGTPYIPSRRTS